MYTHTHTYIHIRVCVCMNLERAGGLITAARAVLRAVQAANHSKYLPLHLLKFSQLLVSMSHINTQYLCN